MRPLLSLAAVLLASSTWAQSTDRPLPYSEDPPAPEPSSVGDVLQETETERRDRDRILAPGDDPNVGLAVEGLAGLFLVDSSKGAFGEPQFAYGARATWEFGRVFGSEGVKDTLFADVSWFRARQRDGTQTVFDETTYDLLSVAPAWAFPFNDARTLAIFLQAGGGVCRQVSQLSVQGNQTALMGLKPLIQYGVGLRGTPTLSASPLTRLSFRVELTRFRRDYMNDTFIGGSVGLDF